MANITTGIGLGIGFMIGVLLLFMAIIFAIVVVMRLYRYIMKRRFSPKLFHQYATMLLRKERFEELQQVKDIIEQLETGARPKELLKHYEVFIKMDFQWLPTPGGGERLSFIRKRNIIRI